MSSHAWRKDTIARDASSSTAEAEARRCCKALDLSMTACRRDTPSTRVSSAAPFASRSYAEDAVFAYGSHETALQSRLSALSAISVPKRRIGSLRWRTPLLLI